MRTALAASGAVLTLCVVAWSQQGDPTARIAWHLALWGSAFAAYLVALLAARGLTPHGLRAALVLAIAWRAVLVAAPPLLSDDVYRYVWDGRIQRHGGNPFTWADRPTAPKWEPLRDETWSRLNHPNYSGVYPPLWQIACVAVVAVHDSVPAMKAFVVLCELLTMLVLARLLRRRGLPRERLLVLAWSPLALLEIAGSGHNDAFGFLFVVLALAALDAGRPLPSAVAAALGFQAKLLPGLIAVAWARRYRLRHALAAGLAAALLVLPYAGAGADLVLTLRKYARYIYFNETLFALLTAATGSHDAALVVAAVLLAGVALALAGRRAEPVAAAQAVVVAWLLLGHNILPWYALWLLPLLVLRELPAALLFTGTVELAYLVYPTWRSGERWLVGWDVRALEYLPCLAVAAVSGLRSRWRAG